MKKLTSIMLLMSLVLTMASCGGKDSVASESSGGGATQNITETASPNVTDSMDSSSDEVSYTRDDIDKTLEAVYNDTASANKEDAEYMTPESVELLTKSNYGTYKSAYDLFLRKANTAVTGMVNELPDRCVIYGNRKKENFAAMKPNEYYVLDPTAIAEDDRADAIIYLDGKFENATFGKGYDVEYLEERFGDLGTVLVRAHGSVWYYFDTATGEAEIVELFPTYSVMRKKIYDVVGGLVKDDYEKDPEAVIK